MSVSGGMDHMVGMGSMSGKSNMGFNNSMVLNSDMGLNSSTPRMGSMGAGPPVKRRRADAEERDACTLFIGGLGSEVTKIELEAWAASQEGFLEASMKDEGSGRAAGWVRFESREAAKVAEHYMRELPMPSLGKPPRVAPTGSGPAATSGPPVSQSEQLLSLAYHPQGGITSEKEEKDARTLFIGGLGSSVFRAELEAWASTQEGLVQVSMKDEGTGRAAGWCLFDSRESAKVAEHFMKELALPSLGKPPRVAPTGKGPGATYGTSVAHGATTGIAAQLTGIFGLNNPPSGGKSYGKSGGSGSSTVFLGNIDAQVSEPDMQENIWLARLVLFG